MSIYKLSSPEVVPSIGRPFHITFDMPLHDRVLGTSVDDVVVRYYFYEDTDPPTASSKIDLQRLSKQDARAIWKNYVALGYKATKGHPALSA
ncbi:MAG: hypothetical protein CMI54_03840 [Parcubacteria group bacterium]|nr:hypothetical protein [Parcubacteria group bacterium]|tara:strand:- start:13181 stop:13456 length:276 start_codon:yes stop_codon:yes gene_type:complete